MAARAVMTAAAKAMEVKVVRFITAQLSFAVGIGVLTRNWCKKRFSILGRLRVGMKHGLIVVELAGKFEEVHPERRNVERNG